MGYDMQSGKINLVIDGQWGSTGKGKLAGYLATNHKIDASTCNFMSNAGHTWVADDGSKIVTHQLPTALVNKDCCLMINPGGAITVSRLLNEIEEYDPSYDIKSRLTIHPHTAVITNDDVEYEKRELERISSTCQGCGGSLARKIMRTAKLAKDEPKLKPYIANTTEITLSLLKKGGTVMAEGAQGFDLSLNYGMAYPYTTSRDITPMSMLNDAGVPPIFLGDVYGCLRTFPIRVGNVCRDGKMVGFSGNCHDDQYEVSWNSIKSYSNAPIDVSEYTTVTNKMRRAFTFSLNQLSKFVKVCAPTHLFLNFINHISYDDYEVRTYQELSDKSRNFINSINKHVISVVGSHHQYPQSFVSHVGTGSKNNDMVLINPKS
jgi:adenylosuccinate synthase